MTEINIRMAPPLTSPNPLVLVCTQKDNGRPNLAPVSFFMYTSFNPPMLAFAMGKASNSGENLRRTGRAVLAVPGTELKDAAAAYGSVHGDRVDKLTQAPIPLQRIEGGDIQFPADSRIAFSVTLAQTVEAGDHYLYLCSVDKVVADETKQALFAWNGYGRLSPAQEG